MNRRPPRSPLLPYTTLFRSHTGHHDGVAVGDWVGMLARITLEDRAIDRKSTRLNSSHRYISYSFCFFFNEPAPTAISPPPLHDALPISPRPPRWRGGGRLGRNAGANHARRPRH